MTYLNVKRSTASSMSLTAVAVAALVGFPIPLEAQAATSVAIPENRVAYLRSSVAAYQDGYCGMVTNTHEIVVSDLPGGANPVVVYQSTQPCYPVTAPRLNPDRTQIATSIGGSLLLVDPSTREVRPLTGSCGLPEWNATGNLIACRGSSGVTIVDPIKLEYLTHMPVTPSTGRLTGLNGIDWLPNGDLLVAGYSTEGDPCPVSGSSSYYPSGIWRLPMTGAALGGDPVAILPPVCDLDAPWARGGGVANVRSSPDGNQLAYLGGEPGTMGHSVWVANADGTGNRRIAGADVDTSFGQFSWALGGQELVGEVFQRADTWRGLRSHIARIDLRTGEQRLGIPLSEQYDFFGPSEARATDTDAPTVTGRADRPADAAGWYSAPVTVDWQATDPEPSAGAASDPPDTVASTEGAGVVYTSAPSCDGAGNCATGQVTLSIDETAPTMGTASLTANPVALGGTVTVRAAASDGLSGVAGGEVFVGDDPGLGSGVPARLEDGQLVADLTGLPVGVHTLQMRAVDVAGNWSTTSSAYPVVYDPSGGYATGGGWITPGSQTSDLGDALPGLDGTSKGTFGFVVKYQSGSSTVPGGNLTFQYNAGDFRLKSAAMEWLVVTNSNWAKFQGQAHLNGDTSKSYPFRVDARDDSTNGDRFVLRIYEPGADPSVAEPLYRASGDVSGGQVMIHKE